MEEEKAAAYYDELTRKGSGAARFKQGLGFSSDVSGNAPPERGSALVSSSSFLSSFVRGSNSSSVKAEDKLEKQTELQSIQNKLKKKDSRTGVSNHRERSRDRERERDRDRDRNSRRRSRSRSRERGHRDRRSKRRSRGKSRSRSRERERDRDRYRERRKRSRSRSLSDEDGGHRKDKERGRYRDRSTSPGYQRSEKDSGDVKKKESRLAKKDKNGAIDYAKLIEGYNQMTPAEKVKAKMKLQLSETAGKDTNMGSGSGWERFDFDKVAPVDNDDEEDEIEGAGDDAAVVQRLGQSFRFSKVQARREDDLKAAHDEAMFGAPTAISPSVTLEREKEQSEDEKTEIVAANLLSEKVLAKQQGSWRDRARRKT